MARPLTGRQWESNGCFLAELPRARGANQRVRAGFGSAAERDGWLSAGIAALNAGCTLPDAARYRHSPHVVAPASAPVALATPAGGMPTFEALAHGWLDEYYHQLKNGNAERVRDAHIMVERHLIPAFAGPIPVNTQIARKRLIDFVRRMALEPEWEASVMSVPGADPQHLFTIREAIVACERSEATIRRALRGGRLPGARRGADGQWRIPAADLVGAHLLGAAPPRAALSRAYATDILWVHGKIIEWGRNNGWDIPDFGRGVHAMTPDDEVARRKPGSDLRRPLSIAEMARVASHLHVVHQLVMWLMRVLGLRISEAFGPRVGDIVDLGDVGLAFISAQGGRPFLTRTRSGDVVTRYSNAP